MPSIKYVGSQDFFRKEFDYHPAQGVLTWSFDPRRVAHYKGRAKGSLVETPYVSFRANEAGNMVKFSLGYIVLVREFGIEPNPLGGVTPGPQRPTPDRKYDYYPDIEYLDGDWRNLKLDNLAEGKNWRVRPDGGLWCAELLHDGTFTLVDAYEDYASAVFAARDAGKSVEHLVFTTDEDSNATPDERALARALSSKPPSENITQLPGGRFRVRVSKHGKSKTVGVYSSDVEAREARNLVLERMVVDKLGFEAAVRAVRNAHRPATRYIDKLSTGWRARANQGGRIVHVGLFSTRDAAIMARDGVMNDGLSVFDAASKARAAFPDDVAAGHHPTRRAKRFKQPKPRVADGVKYPKGWDRHKASLAAVRAPVTSPVTSHAAEPSLADLFNAS